MSFKLESLPYKNRSHANWKECVYKWAHGHIIELSNIFALVIVLSRISVYMAGRKVRKGHTGLTDGLGAIFNSVYIMIRATLAIDVHISKASCFHYVFTDQNLLHKSINSGGVHQPRHTLFPTFVHCIVYLFRLLDSAYYFTLQKHYWFIFVTG